MDAAEEAVEDQPATVVDYANLRANTPKLGSKRRSTSKAFGKGAVMRLDDGHSKRTEGYTHMCTYPLETDAQGNVTKICGKLLKVGYNSGKKMWVTTKAVAEMATHAESAAGASAKKRKDARTDQSINNVFTYGMQMQAGANAAKAAGASRAKSGGFASFTLTKEQVELSSAALMFVYGRQRISKAAFDDPYFQRGLRGSCSDRALLTKDHLVRFVRAEFAIFKIFISFIIEEKLVETKGNPFAQGLHDAVTLGNHVGYESMALDFIEKDFAALHVVCVGFKAKLLRDDGTFDGSDVAVARLYDSTLQDLVGRSAQELLAAMRADRAALGVAAQLALEKEACGMHDGDKLGSSAVGKLVRRVRRGPIINGHHALANPFPEGTAKLKKFRKMATYYSSTGSRQSALMLLAAQQPFSVPKIKFQASKHPPKSSNILLLSRRYQF
jgi:hypothetical protein